MTSTPGRGEGARAFQEQVTVRSHALPPIQAADTGVMVGRATAAGQTMSRGQLFGPNITPMHGGLRSAREGRCAPYSEQ